jgi:hypothetical protein
MPPKESPRFFVDVLFLVSAVGEADAAWVVVAAFLTPFGDADIAVVFVAEVALAFNPPGGGGLVNEAGYGPFSVRSGDWSAL